MGSKTAKRFSKNILAIVLALSMSVMMTPVVASADSSEEPNPDDFEFSILSDGGVVPEKKTESIDTDKNGMLVWVIHNGVAEGKAIGSVSAVGTGVEVVAYDTSAASAEVTGDVTATGDQSYGVIVETQEAYGSTSAYAKVGNVEAPNGFKVVADGGTATIVAGNITSTDDDDERVAANLVRANGGKDSTFGTANVDLGDVSSASDGIRLEVEPLGVAVVNAGNIVADEMGIDIENRQGIVIATVSEVEAGRVGIYSHVSKDDSINMVFVDGDVKAANHSALNMQNDIRNKQMVLIAGDATSEATFERSGGLFFYISDMNSQSIALVPGILSGFNGVVIEREGYANPQDVFDLTTWKIVANGGEIIRNDNARADTDAFAESINYIVKVEQPDEGGTVYATKADGSPLDKKFAEETGLYGEMLSVYEEQTGEKCSFVDEDGYEVAHEGDRVILQADLEPGYRIAKAFNNDGSGAVALDVDEDGNFYIDVPRGGGIDLSVELEKTTCSLTFDLAGGTLDGKTDTIAITAEYGETITLPAAPTREGYTFKYWKGSEFAAGAEYTVEGDHDFAAEWEKNEEPVGKPIPATGDPLSGAVIPLALLALIAGLAIAAIRGSSFARKD